MLLSVHAADILEVSVPVMLEVDPKLLTVQRNPVTKKWVTDRKTKNCFRQSGSRTTAFFVRCREPHKEIVATAWISQTSAVDYAHRTLLCCVGHMKMASFSACLAAAAVGRNVCGGFVAASFVDAPLSKHAHSSPTTPPALPIPSKNSLGSVLEGTSIQRAKCPSRFKSEKLAFGIVKRDDEGGRYQIPKKEL